MLIAFLLLAAGLADWMPARWTTHDGESLALVEQTPTNCLLLDEAHWSAEFASAASARGIVTLGVVTPGSADGRLDVAKAAGLTGVALEGRFAESDIVSLREEGERLGLEVIALAERTSADLDQDGGIIGTFQGVWPGVQTTEDGAAKAAPTGAPWIETNSGFVRFVRASSDATVWIAVRPPEGEVIPVARYLQAIGDSAMVGARWVVALDQERMSRLLAREEEAVADWKRIAAELRFWEEHRDWTLYPPAGQLALIQNAASGGLLSNGIIDMLCARHTPLRTVPPEHLSEDAVRGAETILNLDPRHLSATQEAIVKGFARGGGMLLSAPEGWEIAQEPGQFTIADDDVETLDNVWRGINMTIGRANLGARLFNVATMRSELVAAPDGETLYLHLVNYSDYPVENITIRPQRMYAEAKLYAPNAEPADLEIFENGEIDIEVVDSSGIVELSSPTGETAATDHHD